jgi:aspartate kinase
MKRDTGIMTHFERGYSEVTFSKVAILTDASEGIIHKEYHLCTGDPVLLGPDKVKVIGNTNFDIADQMSDMNMEAIHAKAAKEMQNRNIPIRVKNAFEPEHPGTLISRDYIAEELSVEMITGRDDILAIDVYDPDMVGCYGYDYKLMSAFVRAELSYIAKATNANTITHFVPEKAGGLETCLNQLEKLLPNADMCTHQVAIVCVIGSNLTMPGFLAQAAHALAQTGINVLAVMQSIHQVNIQFIIERSDFEDAQLALHRELVEQR